VIEIRQQREPSARHAQDESFGQIVLTEQRRYSQAGTPSTQRVGMPHHEVTSRHRLAAATLDSEVRPTIPDKAGFPGNPGEAGEYLAFGNLIWPNLLAAGDSPVKRP
jgi:hypothetical protein